MQITKTQGIAPNFKSIGREENQARIANLQQERAACQWASEGCNGGFSLGKELELNLRQEYEIKRDIAVAKMAASPSCSYSAAYEESKRMNEIEAELNKLNSNKCRAILASNAAVQTYPSRREESYEEYYNRKIGSPDWGAY